MLLQCQFPGRQRYVAALKFTGGGLRAVIKQDKVEVSAHQELCFVSLMQECHWLRDWRQPAPADLGIALSLSWMLCPAPANSSTHHSPS